MMKQKRVIMLIDDDKDDRELFAEALQEVDTEFELVTAKSGEQALEMIVQHNFIIPELIFLDLNMPGMNGWQCLAQIRKNKALKDTHVIIYSTTQRDEDNERTKSFGATSFLTKPYRYTELVDALADVMHAALPK